MPFNLKKYMIGSSKAITLFEMIFVLTVTLILSAIFIYSSKHIVVRTKFERVKEEHRVLTRALQNYCMDYNSFPARLSSLNAPAAYISSIPEDPFTEHSEMRIYNYFYKPSTQYDFMIISAGPDGDVDINIMAQKYMQLAASSGDDNMQNIPARDEIISAILPAYLAKKIYDPTNGTNSDGDIITLSRQ